MAALWNALIQPVRIVSTVAGKVSKYPSLEYELDGNRYGSHDSFAAAEYRSGLMSGTWKSGEGERVLGGGKNRSIWENDVRKRR